MSIYLSVSLSTFNLSICEYVYLTFCLLIYQSTYQPVDMFTYLPVCLSTFLFIYLSAYLPVFLSTCLPIYLSAYLPVLPINLSANPPVCQSTCLSIHLSTYLPVCLSSCEKHDFSSAENISCPCICTVYLYNVYTCIPFTCLIAQLFIYICVSWYLSSACFVFCLPVQSTCLPIYFSTILFFYLCTCLTHKHI